jgi:hypothetical protein
VPFAAPLSAWMSGDQAVQHIQNAERCTDADAIDQLRNAIAHGALGARLTDSPIFPPWASQSIFHHTGPGKTPALSPGSRKNPSPKQWRTAQVHADGTVNFYGSGTPNYQFEVLRENVLRIWPRQQSSTSAAEGGALKWLVRDLKERGVETVSKSKRFEQAREQFRISQRGFERIWPQALRETSMASAGTRAGRKKLPR